MVWNGPQTRVLVAALLLGLFHIPLAMADIADDALARAFAMAREGNPNGAYEIIQPLADGGNPLAQLYLGKMLAAGQGMAKNPAAAVEWWRRAAEQDLQEAQFSLGAAYAGGIGVAQDRIEGLKWFIISDAETGLAYSMLTEVMDSAEIGLAKSRAQLWKDETARRRLEKAMNEENAKKVVILTDLAADGLAEAQFELARLYDIGLPHALMHEKKPVFRFTLDLQPDPVEANRLFRLAAEQGYAPAQTALANRMEGGKSEAAKWYSKAADQGHSEAQYFLADLYARGDGVRRDPALAIKLYESAAAQKYAPAMRSLGEAYLEGTIAPVDNEKSYMWLTLASISARAEYDERSAEQTDTLRSSLTEIMSSRQIDQAKEAVERCTQTKFRGCGAKGYWSSLVDLFDW
jgi:TPR repeat protein